MDQEPTVPHKKLIQQLPFSLKTCSNKYMTSLKMLLEIFCNQTFIINWKFLSTSYISLTICNKNIPYSIKKSVINYPRLHLIRNQK